MSFLKITDPQKRDAIVNDFLKTKKNIQLSSLVDRVGDIESKRGYEKIFKPITESQKELKEEIQKKTVIPPIMEIPKQLAIEEYKSTNIVPHGTIVKPTNLGPIATSYMSKFANKDGVDKTFGIYNEGDKFFIGNKEINFDNNDLIIDGKTFKGTEGLWDLITSKDPSLKFTDDDYKDYVDLLVFTNTMKQKNNPSSTKPKSSTSKKYQKLIKPIWDSQKEIDLEQSSITGSGLNDLIERFDLLMASKKSGHSNVKDEMISILNKLLKEKVIDKKEHKILLSKC